MPCHAVLCHVMLCNAMMCTPRPVPKPVTSRAPAHIEHPVLSSPALSHRIARTSIERPVTSGDVVPAARNGAPRSVGQRRARASTPTLEHCEPNVYYTIAQHI